MSDISLNISGKLDQHTIELYQLVAEQAKKLGVAFLVVGASARDMVLHYGHGAKIERATGDIDFGIEVPDWEAFHALKDALLAVGFSETKAQHRIISPGDVKIDIVPFGQIEDAKSNIAWPPDGDWEMNVLGFQEACDNAELIRIQESPLVDIPVATPQGMALLKLIAWLDRDYDLRRKDAEDLLYLMTTYESIPSISNWVFEDQRLMEIYDWDLTLASACKLAIDASEIASKHTYDLIAQLFNGEHKSLSRERLEEEMGDNNNGRISDILSAFIDGFTSLSNR